MAETVVDSFETAARQGSIKRSPLRATSLAAEGTSVEGAARSAGCGAGLPVPDPRGKQQDLDDGVAGEVVDRLRSADGATEGRRASEAEPVYVLSVAMSLSALFALGAAVSVQLGASFRDRSYFALAVSCVAVAAFLQIVGRRTARRELVQEALARGTGAAVAQREARETMRRWLR